MKRAAASDLDASQRSCTPDALDIAITPVVHLGKPVAAHGGAALHDVLQGGILQTPGLRGAGEVILALDQRKPVPPSANNDTCQKAADLLLELEQPELLLELVYQKPGHYMLDIGANQESAALLAGICSKWPEEATAFIVLSTSLPRLRWPICTTCFECPAFFTCTSRWTARPIP